VNGPTILPLDDEETICAIQDKMGNILGTGSREVCEVLIHIINKQHSEKLAIKSSARTQLSNVRAAIII